MLKYIGNGTFITGIPARDLTDEEVREHGGVVLLVKTGLYERVETKDEVARRGQVKPVIKKDTASETAHSGHEGQSPWKGQKDGE